MSKFGPKVLSTLERIGLSLKDNTTQTRTSEVMGTCDWVWEYKNQGDNKAGWCVKEVTNIVMDPNAVIAASKTVVTKPAPLKLVVAQSVTPARPNIGRFSVTMSKSELIASDPVLVALGFTSGMDITRKEYEDIRNRVVEYLTAKQYPTLNWVNRLAEMFGTFDYKEPVESKTIDMKTIATDRNNLLLKRKAVEENTLADVIGLSLVEDKGPSVNVLCYGFISKENALKYIKAFPNCYMDQFDSYKIDKKFLARVPFTW
jgi:hypothetical protein